MIRYDTTTSEIVSFNIVDTQDYQAQSIVAISNNEAFYSFKPSDSSTHHLVKASLYQGADPEYSLNETYHKTITGDSTHGSISRLSHDNATLWHAVNLDTYVTYFQLNLTDFSLIRFAQSLDNPINNGGISMEVSQEVV